MRRTILDGLAIFSTVLAACNSAVPPTAPDAMVVEQEMSRPAGTGAIASPSIHAIGDARTNSRCGSTKAFEH